MCLLALACMKADGGCTSNTAREECVGVVRVVTNEPSVRLWIMEMENRPKNGQSMKYHWILVVTILT